MMPTQYSVRQLPTFSQQRADHSLHDSDTRASGQILPLRSGYELRMLGSIRTMLMRAGWCSALSGGALPAIFPDT
jgi:hypothetical protein